MRQRPDRDVIGAGLLRAEHRPARVHAARQVELVGRGRDARAALITQLHQNHRAIGTDHRPWMTDEIGPLGVDVLRAVKAVLDPAGILNPGKLIP